MLLTSGSPALDCQLQLLLLHLGLDRLQGLLLLTHLHVAHSMRPTSAHGSTSVRAVTPSLTTHLLLVLLLLGSQVAAQGLDRQRGAALSLHQLPHVSLRQRWHTQAGSVWHVHVCTHALAG